MELFGTVIAALLTMMVFSYIFGDNVLFKLAAHIFVGVSVGYALIILGYEVFAPILNPNEGRLFSVLPALIFCFLLIPKLLPSQNELVNTLGGIAMAFVLGVGAALSVGGVLFGTLMPQISATMSLSLNPTHYMEPGTQISLGDWFIALGPTLRDSLLYGTGDPNILDSLGQCLSALIIILGTVGTFFYFNFVVHPSGPLGGLREGFVRFWAGMGRIVIIFTLASLFANTVVARVAVLVSRLQFLVGLIFNSQG